jgi:hypothetical protein
MIEEITLVVVIGGIAGFITGALVAAVVAEFRATPQPSLYLRESEYAKLITPTITRRRTQGDK